MLLPLLVDPVPLGVKLTTWTLLKRGIREEAKRAICGTDHMIGLAFSFGVFSAIDDPKPVAPTQGKKKSSQRLSLTVKQGQLSHPLKSHGRLPCDNRRKGEGH